MTRNERRWDAEAWLSCDRPHGLSKYHRYGSHIRNLELAHVYLDGMSYHDFIKMVSVFTDMRTLNCSQISIKSSTKTRQRISTVHGSETVRGWSLRGREA